MILFSVKNVEATVWATFFKTWAAFSLNYLVTLPESRKTFSIGDIDRDFQRNWKKQFRPQQVKKTTNDKIKPLNFFFAGIASAASTWS